LALSYCPQPFARPLSRRADDVSERPPQGSGPPGHFFPGGKTDSTSRFAETDRRARPDRVKEQPGDRRLVPNN
jgi:hypothetical protein